MIIYVIIIIAHLCVLSISFSQKMKKVTVPEQMYKVLIWCENQQIHAEYIYTEHENKFDVSVYLTIHANILKLIRKSPCIRI